MIVCVVLWSCVECGCFFFFKQKTAYEMRISDWSSDVCSSDLRVEGGQAEIGHVERGDAEARRQRRAGADRRHPQLFAPPEIEAIGQFARDDRPLGAGVDEEGKGSLALDHDLPRHPPRRIEVEGLEDRKSTRLNSSH